MEIERVWRPGPCVNQRVQFLVDWDFGRLTAIIDPDDPRIKEWSHAKSGHGGKITLTAPLEEFDEYIPQDITDDALMRVP